MSKRKINIAVLGSTGAVGREITQILEERRFPIASIKFFASERSLGKKISCCGKTYEVSGLAAHSFAGVDLVLSSAGTKVSKYFAPLAVKQGAIVVDNTSAFRMDPKVPLVIPEINGNQIKNHRGIIANPNCSTIVMLMALYPLEKANRISRISVATYQSASGAGARAMEELKTQSRDFLAGRPVKKEILPHQLAFNVFSHNSQIDSSGYNSEETKMIHETHKILKRKDIRISATCVRVPVLRAHSEAIEIDFSKPMTPSRAKGLLMRQKGVKVVDNPQKNYFPMPMDAAGKDAVLVGRIRQHPFSKKTISLFVSGDQIRKGAALNAVQIAEQLFSSL